jgi:hypothetical protein
MKGDPNPPRDAADGPAKCSAADVRAWALALPETEEIETWGSATFRVRKKMFAVLSGEGDNVGVKATLPEQALLLAADPETFSVAHYVGRYGWVTVQLATVEPEVLRALVTEAWRQTAPKRVVAGYDAGG